MRFPERLQIIEVRIAWPDTDDMATALLALMNDGNEQADGEANPPISYAKPSDALDRATEIKKERSVFHDGTNFSDRRLV